MWRAGLEAANHALAGAALILHAVSFVNGAPWSCATRALCRAEVWETRSHTELSLLIHWDSGSWSEDFSSNILKGEGGAEMPCQSPMGFIAGRGLIFQLGCEVL